jgi:hypothetical protein
MESERQPESNNPLRTKFFEVKKLVEGGPSQGAVTTHTALISGREFFRLALEVAQSGDEALKEEILYYLDTREQQIAELLYPHRRK